jgi:ABC-type multidrug transport system permease subunit
VSAQLRAIRAAFRQEWKQVFNPGDMLYPVVSAAGPAIAAGYVVGRGDNPAAISYVFVGAALMALWTLNVFYTGWSLSSEHAQGTLDLTMTSRTPLMLVIFGKALGITAWMVPAAIVSFLIVLGFSGGIPPVDSPSLLVVSGLLAFASVVAFSFIFAPVAFLMGARGGFFNALMPLGTVLSGFLYPIGLLPSELEVLARALPSAWAMDAVVRSVTGDGETWRIAADWAAACCLIVLLLALTAVAFREAEKRVRISGNLGTI